MPARLAKATVKPVQVMRRIGFTDRLVMPFTASAAILPRG